MKKTLLIFLLGLFFLTSCSFPGDMTEQIANTYGSLNSLQYKITVIREDVYDQPYDAYEIIGMDLGDKHTLTGWKSIENTLYKIKKPNKKIIISSKQEEEGINGGQRIQGEWYWSYSPARNFPESKLICNGFNYVHYPENSINSLTHPQKCSESIETDIVSILSSIDDPSKFIVNLRLDGDYILVNVKNLDGSLIEIDGFDIELDNMTIWLNKQDLTLNKIEGINTRSKKGGLVLTPRGYSEQIGFKTRYSITFGEVLFNPEFSDKLFEVN